MTMKPPSPTNINAVAYRRDNGIQVTFDDNCQQISYQVCARRNTKENQDETVTEKTDHVRALLKNLIPGEFYEVSVSSFFKGKQSKIITLKEYVQTYPGMIQNVQAEELDGVITFTWDPLKFAPDKYIVQWRVNNEVITEDSTNETRFEIHFLDPAKSYKLRVMASNSAGDGEMTPWKTYITDPLPPRGFQVIPDKDEPMTSFIVKLEDDSHPSKKYLLTVTGKVNGEEIIVKGPVETQFLITKIKGLEPGRSYFFKVQTIFSGKKSREMYYYAN